MAHRQPELVRHPQQWHELTDPTLGATRPAAFALRAALLECVGADPHSEAPVATLPAAEKTGNSGWVQYSMANVARPATKSARLARRNSGVPRRR